MPTQLPPFRHLLRQIQLLHQAQYGVQDTREQLHRWPKASLPSGPSPHSFAQLIEYLQGCEPEPWMFLTPEGFYCCPFCDDKDRSSLAAFVKRIETCHSQCGRSSESRTCRKNGSLAVQRKLRKIMPNIGHPLPAHPQIRVSTAPQGPTVKKPYNKTS